MIAAALYALLASGLMVFIGRRFVTVAESKNQAEAEYRYVLTRVRENAESIALMGGEDEERRTLDQSFGTVLDRWRDISVQAVRTTVVSQTSGYFAAVLPILLCAPKFLDGSMTLGQIMQAASAFAVVQAALSWLLDNYPRFADWSASARRVASLMISIDMLEPAENGDGTPRIRHCETEHASATPVQSIGDARNATPVVKHAEVTIARGERVLVVGQSGTGKSSLVRAICGQWPWGKGKSNARARCVLSRNGRIFLLAPFARRRLSDARRRGGPRRHCQGLNAVGLGHLVDRLDEDSSLGTDLVWRREAAARFRQAAYRASERCCDG